MSHSALPELHIVPTLRSNALPQGVTSYADEVDENEALAARVRELQQKVQDLLQAQVELIAAEERTRKETAELLDGAVQRRTLLAAHRLRRGIGLLETDPKRGRSLLEDAAREIEEVRDEEVRQASHMLHPSPISIGLLEGIEVLKKQFDGVLEVTVEASDVVLEMDDPIHARIPEALRLTVCRVIEEALVNAHRYARARRVTVRVGVVPEGLSVRIDDDGRGLGPEGMKQALVLKAIAAVVEQAHAGWRITEVAEEGTHLDFVFPLA